MAKPTNQLPSGLPDLDKSVRPPWTIEPYQWNQGGSIAITKADEGVLALIPPDNPDDERLNMETAERREYDIPNAGKLVVAVNSFDKVHQALQEIVYSPEFCLLLPAIQKQAKDALIHVVAQRACALTELMPFHEAFRGTPSERSEE